MADVDWAGFTQLQQQNNQIANPMQRFAQGFQIGALMRQQNAINQAKEQETLARQQLADRQNALQSELETISTVTDPMQRVQSINNIMLKFPEVADKLKTQATFYSDEVKNNTSNMLLPALNALNLGNKDVAIERLTVARDAFKNGGNKRGAEALDSYISDIQSTTDVSPLVQTGYLTLASIIGPDKVMETLSKSQDYAKTQAVMPEQITQEKQKTSQEVLTTAIKQGEAERQPFLTRKAQVEAEFANSNAALDLQKKGWDITKLQNDIEISKQNARIAAMNAQLAKENNELKKKELELKIADAQQKRDGVFNEKVAKVESARTSMDNMLNTAERILKTPMDVVESATGTISTKTPTIRQSTADFEELIENLKSQAFLAQIPNIKGMGALSNAEGEKLQQALQNFSLRQSPKQLIGNIKEAQRLVLKARSSLANEYGVPESSPDMPAVKPVVKRIK